MRVRVMCDSRVPVGCVAIEDLYDGTQLLEITQRFNPLDLNEDHAEEISEAFTVQAQRWAERGGQAAEPGEEPYRITVELKAGLPGGLKILIESEATYTLYLIDPEVMSERGAAALERMLYGRAQTWVHQQAGS